MKRKALRPARTFSDCWMGSQHQLAWGQTYLLQKRPCQEQPKTKAGGEEEEGSVFRRQHTEIPFLAAVS